MKIKNLLVISILLSSLFAANVFAATFNVSTTAQFRKALEDAAVNGEDDTIILEAGTYKTTDDSLGTFKFSDTEAHNLTIKAKDGLTASDVILDGASTHQVLNLTNTKDATYTLEMLSIKNGKSSDGGGGIYSSENISMNGCIVSNNTSSSYDGGGINGSSVTITNSTISGNTASSYGGGIYGSSVTVANSTISKNNASYGGGIRGDLTLTNSTISDNTASSHGGGILGSSITVTNSTISGNTASGGVGGGIEGGPVIVTKSIISGNTAYSGGGISSLSCEITVTDSTISDNTASYGGGAGIYGSSITITNSTISDNTAATDGGGVSGSSVTVTNSTISGNKASSKGSGCYGKGNFLNNIFTNNTNTDIYFSGNTNIYNNYVDYTKLENESSYTIIKKNNVQPSEGNLNFADTSFRLDAGSIVIDKGLDPNSDTFINLFTDTTLLNSVLDALYSDKDGNTRIAGSAIDLGAYEYGSSAASVQYTLTVTLAGAGSGTVSATGLTCSDKTCTGTYDSGVSVALTATSASGSIFTGWTGGGCTGSGECEILMNNNQDVTATFTTSKTYTITASAGKGGTIDQKGKVKVYQGMNITFSVVPGTGYEIADVKADGKSVKAQLEGNYYTFTNVTGNHSITATFKLKTIPVTVTAGANGRITPSVSSIGYGKAKVFTVTPNSGYVVKSVTIGGVEQDLSGKNITKGIKFTVTPEASASSVSVAATFRVLKTSDYLSAINIQPGSYQYSVTTCYKSVCVTPISFSTAQYFDADDLYDFFDQLVDSYDEGTCSFTSSNLKATAQGFVYSRNWKCKIGMGLSFNGSAAFTFVKSP